MDQADSERCAVRQRWVERRVSGGAEKGRGITRFSFVLIDAFLGERRNCRLRFIVSQNARVNVRKTPVGFSGAVIDQGEMGHRSAAEDPCRDDTCDGETAMTAGSHGSVMHGTVQAET